MQEMWNVFPACLWPYYKLLKTMRQMFQHMWENLWDRYTRWERHFGQGRYYSMHMIFWKFTSEPSKVIHYFWNRTLGFVARKVPTHFYLSRRVHTLIVWGMLYHLFGGQFEAPTSMCLINIPVFWVKERHSQNCWREAQLTLFGFFSPTRASGQDQVLSSSQFYHSLLGTHMTLLSCMGLG